MGQCKSKHSKISILDNTFVNLQYFNILNFANLYFPAKTIYDVKNNAYQFKILKTNTHDVIIIVIKKNKNFITTIWSYDNSNVPFNIVEIYIHTSERELDIYLKNFSELLFNDKIFDELNCENYENYENYEDNNDDET